MERSERSNGLDGIGDWLMISVMSELRALRYGERFRFSAMF